MGVRPLTSIVRDARATVGVWHVVLSRSRPYLSHPRVKTRRYPNSSTPAHCGCGGEGALSSSMWYRQSPTNTTGGGLYVAKFNSRAVG